MFQFNPGVNDTSGQILGQGVVNAANTTAQANVKLVDDIGGSLMGLAGAYADKSAMKAKAQSYAKIGDILGDTMFSENPNAMNALSELKKSKNPYEAVMGYEALFNMAGPMSNAMMAGRRVDVTQQGQQAATDRMYELERLRRERELMNKPPQSGSVFTGGNTVRGLFNTQ